MEGAARALLRRQRMSHPIFISRATNTQRRRQRGVTLLEVLIVVAILAMVSAGVGVKPYTYHVQAQRRLAATNARELRSTIKTWWLTHESAGCPTVAQLV